MLWRKQLKGSNVPFTQRHFFPTRQHHEGLITNPSCVTHRQVEKAAAGRCKLKGQIGRKEQRLENLMRCQKQAELSGREVGSTPPSPRISKNQEVVR